jgi:photosystem II stability/assembly factor-like uncharacterized protein
MAGTRRCSGSLPALLTLLALLALVLPGCVSPGAPPSSPTSEALTAAQQMQTLVMFDERHGWATTQRSVLRTDDGCLHWQDVTPGGAQAAVERIVTSYLNATRAWVALILENATVTPIYYTDDGGRSWQHSDIQTRGIGVVQITFLDALHGWLLANQGLEGSSEAVAIWRTGDGGRHWQQIVSVTAPAAGRAGSLPFSGNKSGLSFATTTTGWASGSEPGKSALWLYVTHDGGLSWQPQTLPLPAADNNAQIATLPPHFFNAQEGILPVNIYAAGTASLYFYVTHDGGASWQYGEALPASVIAWSFVDVNDGYATDRSALYTTNDGGRHWTRRLPGASFVDVIQLDFLSLATGWALRLSEPAATHLLKTGDGGRSWVQIA